MAVCHLQIKGFVKTLLSSQWVRRSTWFS